MRVLIVDTDNENIQNIRLTLSLNRPDWQVSTIDSGKHCLDIVKNSNCTDVVILRMGIIDMSALDLIGQISDQSDINIVILSNDRNIETIMKAFDAGADDYILYPFNKQIFVASLEAIVRRSIWNKQMPEIEL
jgi:DNA-binding response OmpR family regulator